MGRPKSDNPRSEVVKLRVTVGEKAQIERLALAGGLAVADYVRGRALVPSVGLLERTDGPNVSSTPTPELQSAPTMVAASMPSVHNPRAWWCPESLCNKRSLVKGERCPVHGTPMSMKSRGS